MRDRDVLGEQVEPGGLRAKGREGGRADKAGRALGEHGHDMGACVDKSTAQFHGLVSGDPPAHA